MSCSIASYAEDICNDTSALQLDAFFGLFSDRFNDKFSALPFYIKKAHPIYADELFALYLLLPNKLWNLLSASL